jgi:uncharacterized protein (TIGR02996 family)
MMPSTFTALHRAILEDPASDGPRLALAAWLRHDGMPARADSLGRAVRDRTLRWGPLPGPFSGRAIFHRGLVNGVVLGLDTFLVHGREIFGSHPITYLEFTDRDPEADQFGRGTWGWITGFVATDDVDVDQVLNDHRPAMLPDPLAGVIEGRHAVGPVFSGKVYATKDDAIEALSRAAVRIGRTEAGLPPFVEPPATVSADSDQHFDDGGR